MSETQERQKIYEFETVLPSIVREQEDGSLVTTVFGEECPVVKMSKSYTIDNSHLKDCGFKDIELVQAEEIPLTNEIFTSEINDKINEFILHGVISEGMEIIEVPIAAPQNRDPHTTNSLSRSIKFRFKGYPGEYSLSGAIGMETEETPNGTVLHLFRPRQGYTTQEWMQKNGKVALGYTSINAKGEVEHHDNHEPAGGYSFESWSEKIEETFKARQNLQNFAATPLIVKTGIIVSDSSVPSIPEESPYIVYWTPNTASPIDLLLAETKKAMRVAESFVTEEDIRNEMKYDRGILSEMYPQNKWKLVVKSHLARMKYIDVIRSIGYEESPVMQFAFQEGFILGRSNGKLDTYHSSCHLGNICAIDHRYQLYTSILLSDWETVRHFNEIEPSNIDIDLVRKYAGLHDFWTALKSWMRSFDMRTGFEDFSAIYKGKILHAMVAGYLVGLRRLTFPDDIEFIKEAIKSITSYEKLFALQWGIDFSFDNTVRFIDHLLYGIDDDFSLKNFFKDSNLVVRVGNTRADSFSQRPKKSSENISEKRKKHKKKK